MGQLKNDDEEAIFSPPCRHSENGFLEESRVWPLKDRVWKGTGDQGEKEVVTV